MIFFKKSLKNFEKKLNKERGFTLVEMMTVLGIISILTSIVFLNYHNLKDQFSLERSVYQLVRDIRRASEMAMGAYIKSNISSLPRRYGVFINSSADQENDKNKRYYFLFFDQNDNGIWKEGSPDNDIKIDSAETFYEQNVYLKEISTTPYSNCNLPSGNKYIYLSFKPPAPQIEIKIGDPVNFIDCSEIKLIFASIDKNLKKSVIVNVAGLVDIE